MDYDNFTIDDNELATAIKDFAPKGKVRSYEELKEDAKKKMDLALVHYLVKTFDDAREEFVIATSDVNKDNICLASEISKKNIIIESDKMLKMIFEFAFIFGNYNDKRAWIRYNEKTFIKFPYLLDNKGHSVFVLIFAVQISEKLKKNDNAFSTILTRAKVEINPIKKQFLFSKGHLIVDAKERLAVMADLKIIFEQLGKKDINNRDWKSIKWFNH